MIFSHKRALIVACFREGRIELKTIWSRSIARSNGQLWGRLNVAHLMQQLQQRQNPVAEHLKQCGRRPVLLSTLKRGATLQQADRAQYQETQQE